MAEAEELCDRVAVLHRGKVVALGTPAELKEAHRRNGETPSLEDVFLAITGKRIADDAQPEETDEE
jgi:ABC-2 type transport system ATP-binding protein